MTQYNSAAEIKTWFEKAVPEPKRKNVTTQTGVHFEEVAEMLDEMVGTDPVSEAVINETRARVRLLADCLKAGSVDFTLRDRAAYCDALCDQVVTSIGTGHMEQMNILGALEETSESNNSKFDADGKPIFNENMKIMKNPETFFKADYSKYV